MARIDPNRPVNDLPQPGLYLMEIVECEEKRSHNGDLMFVVSFAKHDDLMKTLVKDRIMLEGKGWSIGKEKLWILDALPQEAEEVQAHTLVGKRVWVVLIHKPRKWTNYKGEEKEAVNAEIDVATTNPWCGYWRESEKPEGIREVVDEAPF